MIEAYNISKSFDDIKAVDNVTITIKEGQVFGLIGTNGAGKSTILRMMAGVLKPDEGEIQIDGKELQDNPSAKEDFFYISDEQYFFTNATPDEMMKFYTTVYKKFDKDRYAKLMDNFALSRKRKINTFSKGMKKQFSIILGICAGTKYMYCDETFDGLDPVMRQGVKSLFAGEISERQFTPVIASHNLRELEDICDYVGLLHQGGMILSEDLDGIKGEIHKVQCVIENKDKEAELLKLLNTLTVEHRGSLLTFTARGREEDILQTMQQGNPLFLEVLPLSLEEIFICETGVEGYDVKKLIY